MAMVDNYGLCPVFARSFVGMQLVWKLVAQKYAHYRESHYHVYADLFSKQAKATGDIRTAAQEYGHHPNRKQRKTGDGRDNHNS